MNGSINDIGCWPQRCVQSIPISCAADALPSFPRLSVIPAKAGIQRSLTKQTDRPVATDMKNTGPKKSPKWRALNDQSTPARFVYTHPAAMDERATL